MPSSTPRLAAAGLLGALALGASLAHPAAAADTGTPVPPVNLLSAVSAATAENGAVTQTAGVFATTTAVSGWSVTAVGAVPVQPGTLYTGAFDAKAATVGRQVVPYLYFYDSAANVIDKVKGVVTQDTTTGWTSTASVLAAAPAAATSVSLVELTWGSLAGETHYLGAPTLTSRVPVSTDVVGPLRTVGNQVYDARGPIVLKGINRIGFETSPTGRNLSDGEFAQAKRWGATMIRVPMSSAFWLSTNCKYDAAYAGRIDSFVQQITSRGMVALLDLHTNNLTGCGASVQQPMADLTAVDFWTQVATRYKANPLVAFELYNEPHDISDAVWLNGGTVTLPSGATYQAAGMQALYDTVRATGATNLVFVNGTNWAQLPTSRSVTGSNVVLGVHAYSCPTGLDSCNSKPLQAPASLSTWVTAGASTPIVVTEFGYPSIGSGTYNANVIALLKSRGWGWTAFAWDGSTTGMFSLLSTAGAGASYQPTPAGMPVLSALSAG